MPTLYTHYKFGREVKNNLKKDVQKQIQENIQYYDMFNQGFDNLYYHHFKWRYYKNFGIKAHKQNIPLFFDNMITYLKTNNLQNNSCYTAMVYGFINHYVLDTLLHPYINYQVKNLNIPHTKIEFMLDYYFYNQKWTGKIYRTLIPKVKFDKNLTALIDYTFFKTYGEQNIGKIFKHSHHNGYFIYRFFIYDKSGFKTAIYKLVDKIFKNKDIKFSENSFYIPKVNKDILNSNHLNWHIPKNSNEIYDYSFLDIYNYAKDICIKLDNLVYDILNSNKNKEELLKIIANINLKNIPKLLKQ